MKVSVLIPTFNSRDFIDRAVESLLAQTRPIDEIILIDDRSRDGTKAYLEERYAGYPQVIIVETPENGGPSRARNVGMAAATGDYIALLDADDAWDPGRNEHFAKLIADHDADFVADNLLLYDGWLQVVTRHAFKDDGSVIPISTESLFLNDLVTVGRFNYAALKPYMRRAFLEREGLKYDEAIRYGEDFKLYADMLFRGATAILSSRPGYVYTQRIGEASRKKSDKSHSNARFDILHQISLVLREAYSDQITPAIDRAMAERERDLLLVHDSNMAREYRHDGQWLRYALFVLARPRLLALLARRQIALRLGKPA